MNTAILGFSQSGKKSLFSLLSGRDAAAVTHREGEAIEAVARVRDPRVDRIAEMVKPLKVTYADLHIALCADVAMGSEKREWLDAARRADLLCLVVRAFTDESVYHPAGSVSPERDRGDLEAELLLADLEVIEKRLERIGKEKRSGQTPAQVLEEKTLARCKKVVEEGKPLSNEEFLPPERQSVASLGLLSLLPVLWVYNVNESALKDRPHDAKGVFSVSCRIEREIMGFEDPEERRQYLADLGVESSGLDRMAAAAYDAMGLMSFYTMGEKEVRAWTIRKGSLAPTAGGKIHTDIERGFIRVEVIKYDELIAAGSEAAVRAQGKVRLKGKDYVIEDGDICLFRFSV